ncbi:MULTISPECIES: hypothetical protein [unclassified Novosphingobium]|nr:MULTISPECIES: hypothetical protein [unclassified Novosphingobium]PTR05125.1 hypothetical protein C8K11_1445 [Novosphingobium sp. GV055]PUA93741.1 hypothetical protein C8K12_1445 [Novosphingobium sp. GV061]PUB10281.1 hypothetical protein C8K14_1465 [Novosphingobium sp. GV079]PUB36444.1 hypothetical protein C8K10_1435 [Novosphingobium sp. GV027]
MIGFLLIVGLISTSIASGLDHMSAWWILPVAFLNAVWGIATGPMYDHVMAANLRGDLRVFPRILAIQTVVRLLPAGAIYGIASIFS